MIEDDDFVRITLRIPKALHADLTNSAARKRSMNAEIITRLERTFEIENDPASENVSLDDNGTFSVEVDKLVKAVVKALEASAAARREKSKADRAVADQEALRTAKDRK